MAEHKHNLTPPNYWLYIQVSQNMNMNKPFLTDPKDYALTLVKQGFTAADFAEQSTAPKEWQIAVLVELAQLPSTDDYYRSV